MEKIIGGLKLLIVNPILFSKYLRKFLIEKLILSWKKVNVSDKIKTFGNVKFSFDFGYSAGDIYLDQMYYGCYEIATVEYMKKILKKGDIFIDVGANVGYITAVAANLVGETGAVHSFEPISLYFNHLKKISSLNSGYTIIANDFALGEENGTAKIYFSPPPHIGGSSMVTNYLKSKNIKDELMEIKVSRLDDYIKKQGIQKIALIKIDVEGLEYGVLRGLENYFKSTSFRPIIICEITPSAYPILGFGCDNLSNFMEQYGYEAYDVFDERSRVNIREFKEGTNVIFKPTKTKTYY